jgi:hypothetical protein
MPTLILLYANMAARKTAKPPTTEQAITIVVAQLGAVDCVFAFGSSEGMPVGTESAEGVSIVVNDCFDCENVPEGVAVSVWSVVAGVVLLGVGEDGVQSPPPGAHEVVGWVTAVVVEASVEVVVVTAVVEAEQGFGS